MKNYEEDLKNIKKIIENAKELRKLIFEDFSAYELKRAYFNYQSELKYIKKYIENMRELHKYIENIKPKYKIFSINLDRDDTPIIEIFSKNGIESDYMSYIPNTNIIGDFEYIIELIDLNEYIEIFEKVYEFEIKAEYYDIDNVLYKSLGECFSYIVRSDGDFYDYDNMSRYYDYEFHEELENEIKKYKAIEKIRKF